MKSFRLHRTMALLAALLWAATSCGTKEPLPGKEQLSAGPVVVEARVRVGERADVTVDTKATYGSQLQEWNVGDELVAVSINASGEWALCGTLSCTAVSGSSEACFEGTLRDFSPRRVSFFFLGNHRVSSLTPSFDFSVQRGTLADLVQYLFLELRDVSLELTDDVWSLDIDGSTVAWTPLVSILTLDFTATGTPGATSTYGGWSAVAKSVSLRGLRNKFQVNLAGTVKSVTALPLLDGDAAESFVLVSPFSANWARSYPMAVIPQTASLSMAVSFRGRGGSGTTVYHYADTNPGGKTFSGGVHYRTSWMGDGFTIVGELSSKDGYNAVNIDGGDNPNGTSGKGGYNGADLN